MSVTPIRFHERRSVANEYSKKQHNGQVDLAFTDTSKVFDPKEVYGDEPNPTVL